MLREIWVSHVALVVKNPAANTGDIRDSGSINLGQEAPLEKGMATHSGILAWENPTDRGAWWGSWVAKNQTQLK